MTSKAIKICTKDVKYLIEDVMKMEQAHCPVTHKFTDDSYIRELKMPAGTFAIGHHQRNEHVNIFLKGKVAMLQEDGSINVISAPMSFIGKPGRKIGYILEDVVWLNVFATTERDVDKLENQIFDKSILADIDYTPEMITNLRDADRKIIQELQDGGEIMVDYKEILKLNKVLEV